MTCQFYIIKSKPQLFSWMPEAAKPSISALLPQSLLMGNVEKKINTLLNLALFFFLIWDFDNY